MFLSFQQQWNRYSPMIIFTFFFFARKGKCPICIEINIGIVIHSPGYIYFVEINENYMTFNSEFDDSASL